MTRRKKLIPLSKTETLVLSADKRPPRHETTEPLARLKAVDLVEFNGRAEVEFIRVITELLNDVGMASVRECLSEAAYELDISTETAKRYLLKHTARRAEFALIGGKVAKR